MGVRGNSGQLDILYDGFCFRSSFTRDVGNSSRILLIALRCAEDPVGVASKCRLPTLRIIKNPA